MDIKKCHLCSTDIFPGEIRCMIAIHIFPDQEDDIFMENFCAEEECPMTGCADDACGCADEEQGEEQGEELFQEVNLVLCKDCQDQFMKNPFVKENLLFLRNESNAKTLH
jgi:hypothetical protein